MRTLGYEELLRCRLKSHSSGPMTPDVQPCGNDSRCAHGKYVEARQGLWNGKEVGLRKEEAPGLTSPNTVDPSELEGVLAHRRQALKPLQLLLLPNMYG